MLTEFFFFLGGGGGGGGFIYKSDIISKFFENSKTMYFMFS